AWVTDAVRAIVFIFPYEFSIRLVQAEHALGAGDYTTSKRVRRIGSPLRELPIRYVNPATSHSRPDIAPANAGPPQNRWPFARQSPPNPAFFRVNLAFARESRPNPAFAPYRISLRPQPLRPLLSEQRAGGANGNDAGEPES